MLLAIKVLNFLVFSDPQVRMALVQLYGFGKGRTESYLIKILIVQTNAAHHLEPKMFIAII